ncbi:dephospho-CoA kinase [Alkalicoccus urumqiensis]|uniref:Dephospho-CoA kinase n=1 Tax=Alkalicoccus urumqiensis TaxID=1548213 RepID=A0A2P6MDE4_ALKUR|nr:dephospho-CoA kinase [Alkalicoccus urumqiensis]PRO64309.1 dephospho-CoA kinase [Alkalicoccus urumqiensis]
MRIGLTGSIATGKSTAAEMLKELDVPVIDADVISREIVEPGTPALEAIERTFGPEVIHPDGTLNREALGEIVFQNEDSRKELNGIIHPEVRRRMKEKAGALEAAGEPVVVLDIPLLFESGLEHMVDRIAVVYVPEALQKERLRTRNDYTEKEAEDRIQSQLSVETKKNKADIVIDNSGSLEETRRQIHRWVEQLKSE